MSPLLRTHLQPRVVDLLRSAHGSGPSGSGLHAPGHSAAGTTVRMVTRSRGKVIPAMLVKLNGQVDTQASCSHSRAYTPDYTPFPTFLQKPNWDLENEREPEARPELEPYPEP